METARQTGTGCEGTVDGCLPSVRQVPRPSPSSKAAIWLAEQMQRYSAAFARQANCTLSTPARPYTASVWQCASCAERGTSTRRCRLASAGAALRPPSCSDQLAGSYGQRSRVFVWSSSNYLRMLQVQIKIHLPAKMQGSAEHFFGRCAAEAIFWITYEKQPFHTFSAARFFVCTFSGADLISHGKCILLCTCTC